MLSLSEKLSLKQKSFTSVNVERVFCFLSQLFFLNFDPSSPNLSLVVHISVFQS